jgi:hypothetical protein
MSATPTLVFAGADVAEEIERAIAPLDALLDPTRNQSKLTAALRVELTALNTKLLQTCAELRGLPAKKATN